MKIVKQIVLLIIFSLYGTHSVDAFLLPPFKVDASTIGNEIVTYATTSSQTAAKVVQEASIIQTAITYGQGAKEAYEFAVKMLQDFGALNLNKLGSIMGQIEEKEAEQTKIKADAAVEIANMVQETNVKIVELDENTRELNQSIIRDPENIERYQQRIRANESKKKELSENLVSQTRNINRTADNKVSGISEEIGNLQSQANELISSLTNISANYDSSEDLALTTETLLPSNDIEVDTHVSATYASLYRVAYFNTMVKALGRVMLIKSELADDNAKANENKVSTVNFESLGGSVGTLVKMKTDNIQALLNFTEILLQKMQLDVARDLALENFASVDTQQAAGDFNLDNYKFTAPSVSELEVAEGIKAKELEELDKEITPSSKYIIPSALGNLSSDGSNEASTKTTVETSYENN